MRKGFAFLVGKYHNKKITVNGLVFDSKKEAARYAELVVKQESGEIKNLETQVRFELIPKQGKERACFYVADFVYEDKDGHKIVEDVKGSKQMITDVFKIKKKLMKKVYNIDVKIII
jgi:hypothetical protein